MPNTESKSRTRTLVIGILGSLIMVYGLGARTVGGPHYGCTGPSVECVNVRGFAWLPLLAVIVGSAMLASQCFSMRAFKNMYMLGVVVMAYAMLNGLLGSLACGVDASSQKINGCTGSLAGAFAHLGLSGLVVVAVTTIFLKSVQRRGLMQPAATSLDDSAESDVNATGTAR